MLARNPRVRVLSFVLAAVAPATACVPGASNSPGIGGKNCTEIGCLDGFTLTLRTSDGSFPVGEHTIEVTVGDAVASCTLRFPGTTNGDNSAFGTCSASLGANVLAKTMCMTTTTGQAVSQSCRPITGQFFEQITVQGTPTQLRVVQRLGETVLLDRFFGPNYKSSEPNGPGCGPACRQAQQDAILSLPSEVSCEADGDCALSLFDRPVSTIDDCFCLACGSVLPTRQATLFEGQWRSLCTAWEKAKQCLIPPCVPPRPAACVKNQCREMR